MLLLDGGSHKVKIIKGLLESILRIFFKLFFTLTPKTKVSKNLRKTIDLYKGGGFAELFAEIRAWDAPYEPVDDLVKRNANVLDLGCGDGLLGNYLLISSPKRRVKGIELNKNRAREANKGVKGTSFEQGDILKTKISSVYDVITLIHVLHHLPGKESQVELLTKISKSLKKNKELLILEIDYKPVTKLVFSWITDAIIVPILFEGKLFNPNFFYRKSNEWKKILSKLGFRVKIKTIHKGMPFSHVLIYAKKVV